MTVLRTFLDTATLAGNATAFSVFGRPDQTYTWAEWEAQARSFAAALIDAGCMPGDVVAILAGNNAVWPIADIGALMAGTISVGLYPTSAAVQVHEILSDCAARVVVVDTEEQLAKVLEVRPGLPNLRVIVAGAGAGAGAGRNAVAWEQFVSEGRVALARVASEIDTRIDEAEPDDIAILIYTSGSTGVPKGARITHCYLTASVDSIRKTLGLTPDDSALSFLPYCHAGERVFGLYTRIATGMSALLVEDHNQLWAAARAFEPTLFGGLPRFYEKIYEALLARYAALDITERVQWDRALQLGRARSLLAREGGALTPAQESEWLQASLETRATIAAMVGRRVRIATSGGATLPAEIGEYLAAAGLTVLGAYGLTEHLCVVMHRPDCYSFDAAGLPMPGTALRIADTGEIQIRRSDLTFSGYQNKPTETREAFSDDGAWLLTGDVGVIDEHGRLHVTGREKELIALSGGKKVAPVPIERRLMESPWISQAVLFGENRKYITALIALRRDYVEEWARKRGFAQTFAELLNHVDVLAHVQDAIDTVNESLSRPEQVKRFAVLCGELSAESDELTPTMKVRRAAVAEKYGPELERLYAVTS